MLDTLVQWLIEVTTRHPGQSTLFMIGLAVVGLLTEQAAKEKLRRALEKERVRAQYDDEAVIERE